jgi:hypothetical protein
MYPRQVTELIIYYQALGFSAEETRKVLKEQNGININLNTIYKHRRSPIGQEMINELIRQQQRDILKVDAENKPLAMKYRNELLKLLLQKPTEINVSASAKAQTGIDEEVQEIIKLSREVNAAPKESTAESTTSTEEAEQQ